MKHKHHILPLAALTGLTIALSGTTARAAAIITTGQTVTGTTTNLSLTANTFAKDADVTLTNSGGNLIYSIKSTTADNDWWIQKDGLTLNTATYKYVQIDFASVTTGAVSAQWQAFWQDDDSTIGTPNSSGQTVGTGIVGTTPFSVVIDMTAFTGANGGTTGAKGWGPGTLTKLRLDMFENEVSNKGKSFTISAITFGSALTPVPEPSSAALFGFAGAVLLLRRRRH